MTEDEAMATIVRGFVEPIARELPMEYALELNRLIGSWRRRSAQDSGRSSPAPLSRLHDGSYDLAASGADRARRMPQRRQPIVRDLSGPAATPRRRHGAPGAMTG